MYITPNLSNTSVYYYESFCYPANARSSYLVQVLQETAPDFSLSTSCAGQITTFTNQTLVTGPQVQTVGSPIIGTSPTGVAPTINRMSVSTSGYNNFASYTDGNLTSSCWHENNTLESTEWMQVNYITPRSVNELDFWYRNDSEDHHADQIRLYYSNGGPWTLVNIDPSPEDNTTSRHYQSGRICPSANIYANRWKIEFDTKAGYRFDLTEIEIFASQPVIGGNITWNINGDTLTGQNVTYNFDNTGVFDVIIAVEDSCSCTTLDTVPVSIVAVEDVELITNNILCFGDDNGSLELEINTSDPINYIWSNNDSTSLIIDSLSIGDYWVYVENEFQGCGDTIFTSITEPSSALDYQLDISNVDSCLGTASLTITPSGGTPPYTVIWNTTDSVPGVYYYEIYDSNLCVIIDSIELIINSPVDTTTIYETSCNPIDTGIVIDSLSNVNGCDSVITTITTLLNSYNDTINLTSCNSIDVGTVIINDTTSLGCDSITTTITTLLNSFNDTINLTSCNPIDVGAVIINDTTTLGCDSITTSITILLNSFNDTINLTSCDPLGVGTVIVNDTTTLGCDSTTTSITTLLNSFNDTINLTSCNPMDVGTVIVNDTTTLGCDSITTSITTLLSSFNDTINLTYCNPVDVGTVVVNDTTTLGCDSITTSITTLLSSFNDTINLTSCNPIDVGTVIVNDTTSLGCDSITTTITILLLRDSTVVYNTSCLEIDTGINVVIYAKANGCDSIITSITTLVYPNQLSTSLSDTTFCSEAIEILYSSESGSNFLWSDGTFGAYFTPEETGEYIVEFTQDATGCLVSDTLSVTIENCIDNCVVALPSAFSPSASNGYNDIYRMITDCENGFSEFELRIYNRWGETVFITNNPTDGWNGIYKGTQSELGVYTYVLEYTKAITNQTDVMTGNITLIR